MHFSKILKNPPNAILLDLDNTLYAYDYPHRLGMEAVYAKLLKMFPLLQRKILEDTFICAQKEIKAQLQNTASSHSRLLYFQRMLELLGLHTQVLLSLDLEQTYWRVFLRNAELFEGVKSFLYALRARQVKICIVTDLTSQIQFRKLIHFGIDGLVDYVVTSEEAGIEKPHENIFRLALHKVQCNPEEVLMIGDNFEKDIVGAEKLGIRTLFKVTRSMAGELPAQQAYFESFVLNS